MVTSAAARRSQDRIVRMATAGLDAESLRREVVTELRRTIGFDAWCWPLVDPASNLATTGIGDIPFWSGLPRMMDLRESATDVFTERRSAGERVGVPVGALSWDTGADLARSVEWREVVGPAGLGDEMRIAFVDAGHCWARLHLFRGAHETAFRDADAELLREIDSPVAAALRSAMVRPAEAGGAVSFAVGVVIIDQDLRATAQTPATRQWLQFLQPLSVPYANPMPASLFQLAARVRHRGEAPQAREPSAAYRIRLRSADGRWVLAEGQLLNDAAHSVAITLRQASPRDVFDLVCLGHRLSAREAEVAALLMAGLDTVAIARRLFVSEHTVYDHIKSIFTKTGVHSRREFVAAVA